MWTTRLRPCARRYERPGSYASQQISSIEIVRTFVKQNQRLGKKRRRTSSPIDAMRSEKKKVGLVNPVFVL